MTSTGGVSQSDGIYEKMASLVTSSTQIDSDLLWLNCRPRPGVSSYRCRRSDLMSARDPPIKSAIIQVENTKLIFE